MYTIPLSRVHRTRKLVAQSDWILVLDDISGQTYYFNQGTGQSLWELPQAATAQHVPSNGEQHEYASQQSHHDIDQDYATWQDRDAHTSDLDVPKRACHHFKDPLAEDQLAQSHYPQIQPSHVQYTPPCAQDNSRYAQQGQVQAQWRYAGFAGQDRFGQPQQAIREQYERYRREGGLLEYLKWQEMVSPAIPQRWRSQPSDYLRDPSRRYQVPTGRQY